MGLPYIDEIPKARTYLQEFKGYNHNLRIGDGEFYDAYNLTNDDYPIVGTRPGRRVDGFTYNILAAIGGDSIGLLYQNSGTLYFKYGEEKAVAVGNYDSGLKYSLVKMGAYIVGYPVGFAYNITDHSVDRFSCVNSLHSATLVNCVKTGDILQDIIGSYNEREFNSMLHLSGYYITYDYTGSPSIIKVEADDNYYFDGYYHYDISTVDQADVYVRIKGMKLYNHKVSDITFNFPPELQFSGDLTATKDIIEGSDWIAIPGIINSENVLLINNKVVMDYSPYSPIQNYEFYDGDYGITYETGGKALDFVIECKNRLWGCLGNGVVNEIYCTALGSYSDWTSMGASADAAWAVSVGSDGEFTGAFTVGDNPCFFKENIIHKVYVSSSGAHQLYNINCRGIQKGSHASIAYVNESIIYKTKFDVVGFDGTNVTPISDALGHEYYTDAIAGAYDGKYVMWCKKENDPYLFVFDMTKGLWQRENAPVDVVAVVSDKDMLYMICPNERIAYRAADGEATEENVPYMLETGLKGLSAPDGKYLVRLDYRVLLSFGSSFNLWIEYDSNGKWISLGRLNGTAPTPTVQVVPVLPRRCEHFRVRISGRGSFKLYSVQKVYEQGAKYGY